ncbi:uncharacterized protein CTRU02_215224 [Colletotrichum truncatum]|uniref:Uncharacterized protein n=1 Tax=Colletotrichum truncatum TaxID=5467 RepID=A0ACC3YD58_COLTU|nr:uncharacterized protein CTRU02_12266 [Colletotrichum truncatum]KAF6784805.1 hypothetical protein CTRU02_12266 [Colletotrichum truncatum]
MLLLSVLSVLLGAAVAHPLGAPADAKSLDIRLSDMSPASPLETRAECSTLDTVLEKIGTSSEVVVYASTGGLTALYVCRRVHGNQCDELAGAIAAAVASIFLILQRSGAISARDGETVESLVDFLTRELSSDGATFESITDATPHLLARYDSAERVPESVASVQGLNYLNTTLSMDVYDFGGGEGHIYLPFNDEHITKRMEKRATAPGFKIAYTTRLQSKLTRAHQIQMSQRLATYWNTRANCCNMHDLIGFVETGHSANFYFRIIPETVNFGLNYETVDSCGQMARFL